jgi:cob(I)alamin adenosyltransferase
MAGERNGLVHVITGEGNGKTTSAVGIAVRAKGRKINVAFVQFLKSGISSELEPMSLLGIKVISGTKYCPNQKSHESQLQAHGFATFCKGCFEINEKDRKLARDAFAKAEEFCKSGEYGLVVLDEIFWAIKEGLISEQEVLALIREKSQSCELILTGRGSTPAIENEADYVSVVQKKKHPFDRGIISRAGIDY